MHLIALMIDWVDISGPVGLLCLQFWSFTSVNRVIRVQCVCKTKPGTPLHLQLMYSVAFGILNGLKIPAAPATSSTILYFGSRETVL